MPRLLVACDEPDHACHCRSRHSTATIRTRTGREHKGGVLIVRCHQDVRPLLKKRLQALPKPPSKVAPKKCARSVCATEKLKTNCVHAKRHRGSEWWTARALMWSASWTSTSIRDACMHSLEVPLACTMCCVIRDARMHSLEVPLACTMIITHSSTHSSGPP